MYVYTFLICSDAPNSNEMLAVPNSLAISENEDKKEEEPCTPRSKPSAQRCFYTIAKENTASQEVERCTYNMFICMYLCTYIMYLNFILTDYKEITQAKYI